MTWLVIFLLLIVTYVIWSQQKTRPSSAKTSRSRGSDDDPLDDEGWEVPEGDTAHNPRPIEATVRLSYRDFEGARTERLVDVRECDTAAPDGLLIGFCHLRQAIRSFRLDRIHRAVDVETGEIIDDICAYAARKYAESPTASLDALFANTSDALRALFYIGKADGRFTAKEKQIFLRYCHAASGDDRITLQQIDNACRYLPIPSLPSFKLICGRLAKEGTDQRQALLDAAESMIGTEKTIDPQEAEAVAYLKKRFALPSA